MRIHNNGLWIVRAGKAAVAIQAFFSKGIVAIGWADGTIDWTSLTDRNAVQQRIEEFYGYETPAQGRAAAVQIDRFIRSVRVGDGVGSYEPSQQQYLIGHVASEALYQREIAPGMSTYRRVSWVGRVRRNALSQQTLNSLGAIQTIFRTTTSATAEIEAKMERLSERG